MRIALFRRRPLTKAGRFMAMTPAQTWQMRAQSVAIAVALYFALRPVTWIDYLWPYGVVLFVFYWANRLLWRLYAIWKNGKLVGLHLYVAGKRAPAAPQQPED
ncbi:hypothetical protein GXW71_22720 [Roseomonas hellenica]|uniref:Uncharacterized protein n=1 Tax=Plastoroseomonas hellenica TaxID=2687306 RepID=A0ABS5F3M5_9PROT|nr:hypothetical protein [Plastoroseomonas hellenica]MBR0667191.1 hypothetical protein [Plastoroseomonas hellenica]